jgi:hypothetical protein
VTFADFLDRPSGAERQLVVVNGDAPDAVVGMLESAFTEQPVGVDEQQLESYDDDTVLLVESDEVVAESPLSALTDSILFVNSDLYTTGTVGLDDLTVPDVLAGLRETLFTLRGYPESNTEKLLLILISRYIERLACEHGGRLRASFQRLSRIDDEVGTQTVYERAAQGDPEVHVYGIPDWTPPPELDLRMHGSYDDDLRRTWFVLFDPPDGDAGAAAGGDVPPPTALLAVETEPRVWEAFWTRDPNLVGDLCEYIERRY